MNANAGGEAADDIRAVREKWAGCPLWEADDKFGEAGYFLGKMVDHYHSPDEFRWNLNAFLQSLRNVTFVLQNTLAKRPGFEEWYASQQAVMRADELLRRFLKGRNIVVKQRNLYVTSRAEIGVFEYRRLRLGTTIEVPAHIPSAEILRDLAPSMNLLNPDHAAEWEEYGVRRTWLVPELGLKNVLDLCNDAWHRIDPVLNAAHDFIGVATVGPELPVLRSADWDLLTETDVDPTLPAKWGWD